MADKQPSWLKIGGRVKLRDKPELGVAVVRYIGNVEGKDRSDFVGLELESDKGLNNGTVNGRAYFSCAEKHGMFTLWEKLEPASAGTPVTASPAPRQPTVSTPNLGSAPSTPNSAVPSRSVTGSRAPSTPTTVASANADSTPGRAITGSNRNTPSSNDEWRAKAEQALIKYKARIAELEAEREQLVADKTEVEALRAWKTKALDKLKEQKSQLEALQGDLERTADESADQAHQFAEVSRRLSVLESENLALRDQLKQMNRNEPAENSINALAATENLPKSPSSEGLQPSEDETSAEPSPPLEEGTKPSPDTEMIQPAPVPDARMALEDVQQNSASMMHSLAAPMISMEEWEAEKAATDALEAQLRAQLSRSEEHISSLTQRLAAAEASNAALRRELVEAQAAAEASVQGRSEAAMEQQAASEALQQERERTERLLAERRTELQTAEAEARTLRAQVTDLQIELRAAVESAERVATREREQASKRQQGAMAELEERVATLTLQVTELEETLESVTLDKEIAEERTEALEEELETLRASRSKASVSSGSHASEAGGAASEELVQQNERLRAALMKLKELAVAEKKAADEVTADLLRENASIPRLQERVARVQAELETERERCAGLQSALDEALESEVLVAKLTQRGLDMEHECEELRATVEDLEQLRELHEQIELRQTDETRALRVSLQKREAELHDANARLLQSRAKLAEHENALAQFRSRVADLQGDVDASQAREASDAGAVSRAEMRLRRLEARLQAMTRRLRAARVAELDLRALQVTQTAMRREAEWMRVRAGEAGDGDSIGEAAESVLRVLRLQERLAGIASLVRDRLAIDDLAFRVVQRVPLELELLRPDETQMIVEDTAVGRAVVDDDALRDLEAAERAVRLWRALSQAAAVTRRFALAATSCVDEASLPVCVEGCTVFLQVDATLSALLAAVREETLHSKYDSLEASISSWMQLIISWMGKHPSWGGVTFFGSHEFVKQIVNEDGQNHDQQEHLQQEAGLSPLPSHLNPLNSSSSEETTGSSDEMVDGTAYLELEDQCLDIVGDAARWTVGVRRLVVRFLDGADEAWPERPYSALQAVGDTAARLACDLAERRLALPRAYVRLLAAKVAAAQPLLQELHGRLLRLHDACAREEPPLAQARFAELLAADGATGLSSLAAEASAHLAAAAARWAAQDGPRLPADEVKLARDGSLWQRWAAERRDERAKMAQLRESAANLQAQLREEVERVEASERELREARRREKAVLAQLQSLQSREETLRRESEERDRKHLAELEECREALRQHEHEAELAVAARASAEEALAASLAREAEVAAAVESSQAAVRDSAAVGSGTFESTAAVRALKAELAQLRGQSRLSAARSLEPLWALPMPSSALGRDISWSVVRSLRSAQVALTVSSSGAHLDQCILTQKVAQKLRADISTF